MNDDVRSATEAVARLQRAAETIGADAVAAVAPEPPVDAAAAVAEAAPAIVAHATADQKQAAPIGRGASVAAMVANFGGARGRAAAASGLCAAIALAAILGLRDGVQRPEAGALVSIDRALPWKPGVDTDRATQAARDQIHALTQDVRSLRAQVQKQADELRVAQAHAAAATTTIGQATARLDRVERDASNKFDQQLARIERVERLSADPVVTSSIARTGPQTAPQTAAKLQPAPGAAAADHYILRSVRDGVATVQTHRGMIEVGPGDTIPGVGRVRSIEKIDGRWVVVMRDGVIDAD